MNFKSFINFESFITISLIKVIYILGSITSVVAILFIPDTSIGLQLLMILGALLGIRFYCEMLIVVFKIGENVSKIASKSISE